MQVLICCIITTKYSVAHLILKMWSGVDPEHFQRGKGESNFDQANYNFFVVINFL